MPSLASAVGGPFVAAVEAGSAGGLQSGKSNSEKKKRSEEAAAGSSPETKKRPIKKFAVKSFDYKILKV